MSTATAIQQLTAEAAQVFDAAFDDFTSCSTGDRFATLNAMTEFALQHQAHLARFAQVLEHSGSALSSVAKDLRYSSTATLLQHEVGFAKGQADAYVRLGKLLQHREYPVLAAAIEAGTISSQQAIIITREFDRQRNHYDAEFIAVADRSAVSFAEGQNSSQPWSPEDLRDSIRGWFAQHDPEQVELHTEQQHARRLCKAWAQEDGMISVIAVLSATDGAAVMQFLDANASPRTRLSAPDGDPEIDMRTREQKMADAFVQAFTTAAKSKHTSTQGGAAPTLLVTVPMSEINKHANGTPALARVSRTQEFVPVAEVSRIICDGAVQAAITDDSGNVLKLGRSQRLFSPTQRKALNVAYPTCATDGCGIPAVWAEAHHIKHWSRGGRTDLDNGVNLCSFHHHQVHLEHLKMTQDPQTQKWKAIRAIRR
ncbi:HNH endonuclease signature motif containing protein [Agrococcus casei]|uniref:Putative HNH endonuclease domain protein n=6 Tax=Agrococcus TaxID=46352 RepID=A0A1R4F1Z8_9MICO|nr:HNH endonuclease signature motif containing protein [Agrococcus casei]SJM49891.1 putative HNH endonuclease domain protein [Agrococcus casei LMG 22410]